MFLSHNSKPIAARAQRVDDGRQFDAPNTYKHQSMFSLFFFGMLLEAAEYIHKNRKQFIIVFILVFIIMIFAWKLILK